MVVVENTPEQHNMVVCTLCSCYPHPVLGLPPVWYKSAPYRSRARHRSARRAGGFRRQRCRRTTKIRVWDSTAEIRFLVLPMRPEGTEGWSAEQLAELVTRDSMIGTGLAETAGRAPSMNGAHDMGGAEGFGPVVPEPNEPVFHSEWEAPCLWLTVAMARRRRLEHRHVAVCARELPPQDYLSKSSYYRIWLPGSKR